MTAELTALALAGLLQIAQFCLYSVLANMQVGINVAAGSRDRPITLTGVAGRAQRALNNHFEGLILFTIAVLVVTLSEQTSSLTAACAWVYLGARTAYIPAYLLAPSPWRSVVWFVGLIATTLMILAALF